VLGLFYDGGAGFCSMMAGLGMCKSVSVKRAVQKTAVVGWKKNLPPGKLQNKSFAIIFN
jgi:hypothetical protein